MEDRKQSKIFATVLQLEEHSRRLQARIRELGGYKMAQRPRNLVGLLATELRDLDEDIAYIKETLNAPNAKLTVSGTESG